MNILKTSIKISLTLFSIYILFGLFLYVNQTSFIYHPSNQEFENCKLFKDYEVKKVNSTRFYLKKQSKNILIYYHGNAGSTCDRGRHKEFFETLNYTLLYVEYAGYSNDPRSPSSSAIKSDVLNIVNYINKNSYDNITVYGQSIGAGVASYHASKQNVNTLILVTPFTSLKQRAQEQYPLYPIGLLLNEEYDNIEALKEFNNKLAIFHGTNDVIIPMKYSQELYSLVPTSQKYYYSYEGRGHNNLWQSKEFKEDLRRELIVS